MATLPRTGCSTGFMASAARRDFSHLHPAARIPGISGCIFAIFGMEHYRAVLVVQMFVDVGTCFLIADIARRVVSPRAAKLAFLLAALCPFLANYAAAALTETWKYSLPHWRWIALSPACDGTRLRTLRPWLGCGRGGSGDFVASRRWILLVSIGLYCSVWIVISRIRSKAFVLLRLCVLPVVLVVVSPGSAGSLDPAQSAYVASLSTTRATLCQRGK